MIGLTPWVRRLLIANVVMFLVTQAARPVEQLLLLYPPWVLYRPWTVVTYMFVHADFMHVLFNMVGLFFFGPRLEDRLGARSFLALYFLAGIGGAAFSFVFARDAAVVGASGAVLGVLTGFIVFWPREKIILLPIPIPIEARIWGGIYLVFTLWAGFNPTAGSRTAHFAHLGGIVFAFAYLKWADWRRGSGRREFQRKLHPTAATGVVGERMALARWKGISVESLHELNREEVERLMAKIQAEGVVSLSAAERQFLDRMVS